MEPRPIIIFLTGKRRPHEVAFFVLSLILGGGYLMGPRGAVLGRVDLLVFRSWAVWLILSGLLGIVGCYWRGDLRRGLRLEQAGAYFNAAAILGFVAMVYAYTSTLSIFTFGVCLTWATAHVVRCFQIRNDLRSLTKGARGVAS